MKGFILDAMADYDVEESYYEHVRENKKALGDVVLDMQEARNTVNILKYSKDDKTDEDTIDEDTIDEENETKK